MIHWLYDIQIGAVPLRQTKRSRNWEITLRQFPPILALLIITACLALAAMSKLAASPSKQATRNAYSSSTKLVKNGLITNKSSNSAPTLVGRDVCGECHKDNFLLHANSGHASTFSTTGDSSFADKFNRKTVDTGEPYGLFSYFVDSNGLFTKRHSDPRSKSFRLQFALGSGHNGVTLFSLIPDAADGTVGVEHRVSWFAHDDNLGLTPAQHDKIPTSDNEHYGVVLRGKQMQDCVSCHTTAGTIAAQVVQGLVPNVNCEKCHGPGSEHVRQARLSTSPSPFSVGHKDWDAESEI